MGLQKLLIKKAATLRAAAFLPPAARGALFEKTAPLDPRQKLLIYFSLNSALPLAV